MRAHIPTLGCYAGADQDSYLRWRRSRQLLTILPQNAGYVNGNEIYFKHYPLMDTIKAVSYTHLTLPTSVYV